MRARPSVARVLRKRALGSGMNPDDLRSFYWLKTELAAFARRLGLPAEGHKPELLMRIERRLRGLPEPQERGRRRADDGRDSDKLLERSSPVVNYKSDDRTRAFFASQIGPHFHFTYHLNQYRLAKKRLTYGDLVDEWLAEYARRKTRDYKAPIASQGEYNQYVRDFFEDPINQGKGLRAAVVSWNVAKRGWGERLYKPQQNWQTRK